MRFILASIVVGWLGFGVNVFAEERSPKVTSAQIEQWVLDFGAKKYRTREVAQQRLKQAGNVAVPALTKATKHESSEVQTRAKKTLAHFVLLWCKKHKADIEFKKDGFSVDSLTFREPAIINDQSIAEFMTIHCSKSVQWLDLSDTKITDATMKRLKAWSSLKNLYLEDTQITDAGIKHLKGNKTIVELYLHRTKITNAAVADLWQMKSLARLYLWHVKITDDGFVKLKQAPPLTSLELYGTQVSDKTIAYLKTIKSLRRLNLNNTKVTKAAVKDLMQMKSLVHLALKNTNFDKQTVGELKKALPKCRIID